MNKAGAQITFVKCAFCEEVRNASKLTWHIRQKHPLAVMVEDFKKTKAVV